MGGRVRLCPCLLRCLLRLLRYQGSASLHCRVADVLLLLVEKRGFCCCKGKLVCGTTGNLCRPLLLVKRYVPALSKGRSPLGFVL